MKGLFNRGLLSSGVLLAGVIVATPAPVPPSVAPVSDAARGSWTFVRSDLIDRTVGAGIGLFIVAPTFDGVMENFVISENRSSYTPHFYAALAAGGAAGGYFGARKIGSDTWRATAFAFRSAGTTAEVALGAGVLVVGGLCLMRARSLFFSRYCS